MKKLGIIGGLGPMATAYFMRRIIELTDAATDQENIEMIIYNCPSIPDRTGFILGENQESPFPKILEIARSLEHQNVDYIAMPCITAHYFHDQLADNVFIPVSNGIKEAAQYLKERGIKRVGIMATDGTASMHLFDSVFKDYDISCLYPDETDQKQVMSIIYDDVKAGKPVDIEKFFDVKAHLLDAGAEVIILGCTELSIAKRDIDVGAQVLDIVDVLAADCVKKCAKARPECENLITEV
ncbi:aspartate/glutamate racemase family protein [Pseudobutyrivibrio xylanivorans]|uniref:Amino acid racemase n=1 Tax=Pseudobutyrivibrio xylanivorans TaxID=185007 RepID=A0A5P6VRU5_PSEXY|nr:amino acid racemase [Pseudobutyrivibrio xylanivorans]QFJ53551.1 amino acid racemase [Pseudobutyrivibrio xylanivorans]